MDSLKNNKLLKIIAVISKILGLFIVVFFIINFIGNFIGHSSQFGIEDYLKLIFIPEIYAVGAFIALKKEVLGSIIMIFSLIIFNIVSYIIEKNINHFDFIIFLIPSVILLFISYIKKKENK